MARSIKCETGKTSFTQYAVYNRTKEELVFEHGVCWAGTPQFWFDEYKDAERLLDKALKYYPDDHILTILKKDVVQTVIDTMPPRL